MLTEDFLKTIQVVESCKTLEHFVSAKNMIRNFKIKHSFNQSEQYLTDLIIPRVAELRIFLKKRRKSSHGF